MGRRDGGSSATGTVLALVGFVSIIAITFGSGFYAGRLTGPRPAGDARGDAAGARGPAGGRPPGPTEMPDLTFYRELTAPLPAPPAPPRPARRPSAVTPARSEAASPAAASSVSLPPLPARGLRPAPGEPAPSRPRYTVQVGAYRERRPAEALRASLAAAGHDVHLVEVEAPGGVRYRVRVGSFATREDAREAAARLTRTGVLSAFVTTRASR